MDLARQVAIWLGFVVGYELVSSFAGRRAAEGLENGRHVVRIEHAFAQRLVEVTLQRLVDSSRVLSDLTVWTYWNSEFTVVALALLWVYLRRHEAFIRFRNAILLANVIGLIGYVLLPTAPPRMFPDFGFDDTLSQFASLNHGSGLVNFFANPYAAMPSLHAADALIVGLVLFAVCRNWFAKAVWAVWPMWVWFSVMATGNHFWLDVLAGIFVALVSLGVIYGRPLRRLRLRPSAA